MTSLASPLRRKLESAIKQARKIAEGGARKALEALAVHEPDPYKHMDKELRRHRKQLQAQAKQFGDAESETKRGSYEIKRLVEKTAYDQWHRLLFARYLLENDLLIAPEHGVSVSLNDCEELAPSLGLKDAWSVAARFAANELPQIFRADDPAGAVELPVEDRKQLLQLVKELPVEVFTVSDSLGWCYQFWQAERKDEVNAAGNKIGADELPAVTQLFTEDYMVDFLLDNTLGAWWAGKVLAANPKLAETAQTEGELRAAVSLPGCPWVYLRFIKGNDGKWTPAAGTFDGWPKSAAVLRALDPCMGSGHFVVAMFERLVALRLAEEKLDEAAAVAAVIRDNLFGLEIDPRCTQIGAFNLALAAWRRVGHCKLPAMNLACSGLAPNTREADWLAIAGNNEKLRSGMERLYRLFKNAPVLGSLINPRAAGGDLMEAAFHELQPLLEKALARETKDDTAHEMAVTAHGLAKAAEILAGRFTLVATNVPYLGGGDQPDELKKFCDKFYPDSKTDLATVFLESMLHQAAPNSSVAVVIPRIWLTYTRNYRVLRKKLLETRVWNILGLLGKRAFAEIGGEVVDVILLSASCRAPSGNEEFSIINAASNMSIPAKISALKSAKITYGGQKHCLSQPGHVIISGGVSLSPVSAMQLIDYATVLEGISRGDTRRFDRRFWELAAFDGDIWAPLLESDTKRGPFGGCSTVFLWEKGRGAMVQSDSARVQGLGAWNKDGIFISRTHLNAYLTNGAAHAQNGVAVVPRYDKNLPAIWAYCSSADYRQEVLKLNQKLIKPTGALDKVPFDLVHWQRVAAEQYPNGLPRPFSSDPTQWLFNGHPVGATPAGAGLHVAVARLLGYQWPRQTGSSFPDCRPLGPDGLAKLADDDGIVPISPLKGEIAAAERLRELLARAYGRDWTAARQEDLLAQVDYAGAPLEDWLRNGFFEQHCAFFHHRPFIWHIWDGLKNGFSALVNYHKLTHANLEKLTFAYLGDWIRRQQAAVEAEESGSDAKLQAAKKLQSALKLILEGEPPYDIFVRWKPISKQAIGWEPDLNDGVRMNIRPFATAGILRKRVKIYWNIDAGTDPSVAKTEFPWRWKWDGKSVDFPGGRTFDGIRCNDCHYSRKFKLAARRKK